MQIKCSKNKCKGHDVEAGQNDVYKILNIKNDKSIEMPFSAE